MSGTVVFFFFFTSLYLRRILWRIRIVFASPLENTKTMEKQWKYQAMYDIIVFNNLRFIRSHENDKLVSFFQTPLWGPFLMPGNTVYILAAGKLNGEKKSVPFQKYPVTCGQGLR